MAHFNLGLVLRNTGRRADAAASFERAVALDADHLGAHGELWVYYQSVGDAAGVA